MFDKFTLWEAIRIGGPVMMVLIFCSVVSVAVILERALYYFKHSRALREPFMESIREEFKRGHMDRAMEICQRTHTPFSKVTATALNHRHADEKDLTEALEREIITEANHLERRIVLVGTIGSTAVYIGLLGTVWGIIRTFRDIAQHGSGGLNIVIGGIAEALVCTAAGLFVAIPAVMAYNYFLKRISRFVTDMELSASEISSMIRGQKRTLNEKNI